MLYKYPYIDMAALTATYQPDLSEAILDVVEGGHYLNGQALSGFESAFATYCGTEHCIGVANGLDALTIALTVLKLEHGWDSSVEVIVPAFTFVATVEAVLRAGLTPVLADVDEQCYVITVETIIPHLSERTRVIVPVHLYGALAPMSDIMALARQYNLLVVEDAAQAHGASLKGCRAGSWGNIAAFSFYPGKNLGALGDGGAIVTDNVEWAILCRILANYGSKHKYHHEYRGYNSRLDDIQAAGLRVKLQRLDIDNTHRSQIAEVYRSGITHPSLQLAYAGQSRKDSVYHIYPIFTERREAFLCHLEEHGVQALIHYPYAIHQLSPYAHLANRLPHSEYLAHCEVSLPISPVQTLKDTQRIVDIINKFK